MSLREFIDNLFMNYIPLAISLLVIWSLVFGTPAFAKDLLRNAFGVQGETEPRADWQSGTRRNAREAFGADRAGMPRAQDRMIAFARDISREDPQIIALADALRATNEIPDGLDFSEFLINELGKRAAPETHMTALILALTELSMTDPNTHLVYFDWREDVSDAARSFDDVLRRLSNRDGAIEATVDSWPADVKWELEGVETALAAALEPFAREGLILLDISPSGGWDAYLFAAVPVEKAQIWANTILVYDENTPLRKGAHITAGQRLASRFITKLRPPGVRQPAQTTRNKTDIFMLAQSGDYDALRSDKFARLLVGLNQEGFERRWPQARREGFISETEIEQLTPENLPQAVVELARGTGRLLSIPRDLTTATIWEVYDQQWLVRMSDRLRSSIPLSDAERAVLTAQMAITHTKYSNENPAAGLELFFGTMAMRDLQPLLIDTGGNELLVTESDKRDFDFWVGQSLGGERYTVELKSPFAAFDRPRFESVERRDLRVPLLRRFIEEWRATLPHASAASLPDAELERIATELDPYALFGTKELPVFWSEYGADIRNLLDPERPEMQGIAEQYGILLPGEDWLEQLFAEVEFDRETVGFLEGFGLDKLDGELRVQGWAIGHAVYQEYEVHLLFLAKSEMIDRFSRTHFAPDFLIFNNADYWHYY